MLFKYVVGAAALLSSVATAAPIRPRATTCPAVPDFVIKNAPIMYFEKAEKYFPGKPEEFLQHVKPLTDAGTVIPGPTPLSPSNLDQYPPSTYLTSLDNVETNPSWLTVPEARPNNQISTTPITLITVDKGSGILDAFYFTFFPFNHGPAVLGLHFGNHVGDWEHVMIRFKDGNPTEMYFSAHGGGSAYEFAATEKDEKTGRPVAYIARGSHAFYANNGKGGKHSYALPFGLLADRTSDKGSGGVPFDSSLGARSYCWSKDGGFAAAPGTAPEVGFLNYQGRWGDRQLPTSDRRQVALVGQFKYTDGPTGPFAKNLNRVHACEDEGGKACEIKKANNGFKEEDELQQAYAAYMAAEDN